MGMKQAVRQFIPKGIFDAIKEIETNYEYKKWENAGKPIPPSSPVKRLVIREYQKQTGHQVLVETGTYKGDMVYCQMNHFREIYSVELADFYYEQAVRRFKKYPQIHLYHGDSAKMLGQMINEIEEPIIFWLDGHYSGGMTAKGEQECPIWGELDKIFPTSASHVLLIDDARCFVGENGYPTLDELRMYFDKLEIPYTFEVDCDVIRVCLNKKA